jgi:transposase
MEVLHPHCAGLDVHKELGAACVRHLGLSGRRLIEALIAGQTAPQALAKLADGRLHATRVELEASLRGRVTAHHRFMLSML